MSAVSISGRSPTRWVQSTTRLKPTTPNTQPIQIHASSSAANLPIKTFISTEAGVADSANGTKISFAPGTSFDKKGGTRGSKAAAATTLNLRPVTSGERNPQFKFRPPKATLPTLQYLSVSQEDFLDPRYAEDIVKSYGIPRYFLRSKSNLLVPRTPSKSSLVNSNNTSGEAPAEDQKSQTEKETSDKDTEPVRPKTSDATVMSIKAYNRLPNVVPVPSSNQTPSGREGGNDATKKSDNDDSTPTQFPKVVPVYKPLVGDKYTHARFFPPMNPYRSLQFESEVTKYVEHKKRVGQGKYVRFADTEKPSSSLLREATMYDLNRQGPVERPLDQFLPPPDRKSFLRQRPRDIPRPIDPDPELAILPRERSFTEGSNLVLKDMIKR